MGPEMGRMPIASSSEVFEKLVSIQGKNNPKGIPSKFVKRIKDVPVVALPPEDTMCVALSLADLVLIGKFTGI